MRHVDCETGVVFGSAEAALVDLRVAGCALRAAADEDDPLDAETRQAVVRYAVRVIRESVEEIEAALDFLEDR